MRGAARSSAPCAISRANCGTAGSGSVGFLYYSGHGAAEKDTGVNYVIPVDAKDPGSASFWDDSVKLDDIMKVADQQGFFVAYASAPGRTASDRGDKSGPYAAALATELTRQGLDHLNLFQNVKESVIASTGGSQHPWESNGLTRRVYLTGEPTTPADMALWESVRTTSDIPSLQRYLDRFPKGVFAATAKQMIERLEGGGCPAPRRPAVRGRAQGAGGASIRRSAQGRRGGTGGA